jgi:predicted nucleotidyltransferase/antitoxin (DNA-binding transcriptional repressor) of toxin-antitoxin stability system
VLGRVGYGGEVVIVERSGKPMAVIIPVDMYEGLVGQQSGRVTGTGRLGEAAAAAYQTEPPEAGSNASRDVRSGTAAMEWLKAKREEILRIADRYGARNVRVFGSAARGQATSTSDMDILVDLEPGRSLLDLGGLLDELRTLLGCPVDVVTPNTLREHMRQRVLQEAVPL